MNNEYFISIYLDTRRVKANGKYPVKLRVFDSKIKKQKLYPTQFNFTAKEFASIWTSSKPRKEYKQDRLKIQSVENRAHEVAQNLDVFSFENFERKLFRKKGDGIKVEYHYKKQIEELKNQERVSTASSYGNSLNSLKEYSDKCTRTKFSDLTFFDITKEWLEGYERFIKDKKGSITTVGIYLRALRAIFNVAIAEDEIKEEIYPFGKRKYQIPSSKKVKKSLTLEQIKKLHQTTPITREQEIAKDFWFLSYNCNGVNLKDIAYLKYKDISEDKIMIYRAKTINTTKSDLKQVVIYQNDFIKTMILKYGNKDTSSENFVFDIITNDLTPIQRKNKIKNFNRFINQHIKNLCKQIGLPEEVSYQWARHSFATIGVRKGMSLEFMQESLGHKNLKTTQNYFAGFEDESKKEFSQSLMDF